MEKDFTGNSSGELNKKDRTTEYPLKSNMIHNEGETRDFQKIDGFISLKYRIF